MMKTKIFLLVTMMFASTIYSQSSIVFGVGTNIEVGSGANISADVITVNGTFSGNGTFNHGSLPVELVSFIANSVKDQIILNWKTATELNNSGFEVQREVVDAVWKGVGFVVGAGNSTTAKEYSFVDAPGTRGSIKYRLKQIDYGGTYKYSNIIEINLGETIKEFELSQNYPNPFNPSTKIAYQIPKNSFVTIKVFDVLGKQVALLVNEEKTSGNYEAIFDAKELAGGIYYYTIKAGDFAQSKKMILLK